MLSTPGSALARRRHDRHRLMARSLLKFLLIAAAVPPGATVAMAQFNPFSCDLRQSAAAPQNNVPGPSSVPGGRQQMGTPSPTQPAAGYPGGSVGAVQSRPLPAPGAANQDQPPLAALPPGQRQPRPAVAPFDPSTPPGDDVIAEPPAQKITNGAAQFAGLDKITGRITSFDVTVRRRVQFDALQLTPRLLRRPPTETANTDALSRSTRSRFARRGAAHLQWLDVCSKPRPQWSASDLMSGSPTASGRWWRDPAAEPVRPAPPGTSPAQYACNQKQPATQQLPPPPPTPIYPVGRGPGGRRPASSSRAILLTGTASPPVTPSRTHSAMAQADCGALRAMLSTSLHPSAASPCRDRCVPSRS